MFSLVSLWFFFPLAMLPLSAKIMPMSEDSKKGKFLSYVLFFSIPYAFPSGLPRSITFNLSCYFLSSLIQSLSTHSLQLSYLCHPYIFLGLPLVLLPSGYASIICLGFLSYPICTTYANHFNCFILILLSTNDYPIHL